MKVSERMCVKMKKKKSTAADVRPRQTEGEKWAELARRVRNRRIIYAAALILIAAAVTVCVGNYRCCLLYTSKLKVTVYARRNGWSLIGVKKWVASRYLKKTR